MEHLTVVWWAVWLVLMKADKMESKWAGNLVALWVQSMVEKSAAHLEHWRVVKMVVQKVEWMVGRKVVKTVDKMVAKMVQ